MRILTAVSKLSLVGIAFLPSLVQGQCTLCSGGATFDPLALTEQGVPCSVIAAGGTQLAPAPDPDCLSLQLIGFLQCGCPDPPLVGDLETCHICGSDTISFNEDKVLAVFDDSLAALFGNETTCGELNSVAQITPVTEAGNCDGFTQFGPWCECEGQSISCPLCPDGSSVPDPDLVVPGLEATCSFFEFAAALFSPDEADECADLQSLVAIPCMCPNVNATCTLCPLGESPPGDGSIPGVDSTCTALETLAAGLQEPECTNTRQLGVLYCGCEPDPNQVGPCGTTICPGGEAIPQPDNEVLTGVTCADFENALGYFQDPSGCDLVYFAGVNVCGCAGEPATCPLCEDGSFPENPPETIDGDLTCLDAAYGFFDFPADSPTCQAIQATAGVYCGCDNPLSSEGACRLCGGTTLLPDPTRLYQGAITCGVFEFQASGGDDGLICEQAQALAGPICCGDAAPSTVAPSTQPPVPATTSEPTTAPPVPTTTSEPTTAPPVPATTSEPTPGGGTTPTEPTTPAPTPPSTPAPTTSSAVSVRLASAVMAALVACLALVGL